MRRTSSFAAVGMRTSTVVRDDTKNIGEARGVSDRFRRSESEADASATHHPDLEWAEKVLDLLGTIGSEAVADI